MSTEELQDTGRVLKSAYNFGIEIYRLSSMLKEKKVQELLSGVGDKPFVFTGNITDLCYFHNNDAMDLNELNHLEPNLKEAVWDTLQTAEREKLIKFDSTNNSAILTDKGNKYINKPSFIKEAIEQQAIAFEEKKEELINSEVRNFSFNGTTRDLDFFEMNPKLDLSFSEGSIKGKGSDAKELLTKIKDNFNRLEKAGIVQIKDSTAVLTEKGKHLMRKGGGKAVNEALKLAGQATIHSAGAVASAGATEIVVGAVRVAKKTIATAKSASKNL